MAALAVLSIAATAIAPGLALAGGGGASGVGGTGAGGMSRTIAGGSGGGGTGGGGVFHVSYGGHGDSWSTVFAGTTVSGAEANTYHANSRSGGCFQTMLGTGWISLAGSC